MNYTYEYKKLREISAELVNELAEFALAQSYSPNTDFNEAGKMAVTPFFDYNVAIIKSVVDNISDVLDSSYFINAYINILPAMSYITEHTDGMYHKLTETVHRIHIPLITNDRIGMMWDCRKRGKPNTVVNFKTGSVYLYNNVARHSIVNISEQDRYHLLLRYDSPAIIP